MGKTKSLLTKRTAPSVKTKPTKKARVQIARACRDSADEDEEEETADDDTQAMDGPACNALSSSSSSSRALNCGRCTAPLKDDQLGVPVGTSSCRRCWLPMPAFMAIGESFPTI